MIDSKKDIRIIDDRSKNPPFTVDSILYESDDVLLVSLGEAYGNPEDLCLINKKTADILTTNFEFYYAENF